MINPINVSQLFSKGVPGMHNKKIPHGFTIVELLIVVVIIGILAAVAIPAYFNYILRSRQADAYHNLLDMKAAQEMFYSMNNDYAGDYEPLHTYSNTFTKMLSFAYTDTEYYMYYVTSSTSPDRFEAWVMGQHSKLIGNKIRIRNDEDPCIESPGSLKLSLNLEDCL
jgi:prepilin-type N-terminal cleavage/methylation domain-containing protein